MSPASFQLIEDGFKLPAATLQAAFQNEGVCSRRFVYFPGTREVNRIEILVKAAQKVDIANYLLSLSYEVSTGSTTAFILGDGITTPPDGRPYEARRPGATLGSFGESQSKQIRALIGAAVGFWRHPMLLPVILIQSHFFRMEAFSSFLGDAVLELEHAIGVAFPKKSAPVQDHSREYLFETTTKMHATMVQILFATRVCHWETGYAAFLLKTHDEVVNLLDLERPQSMDEISAELREAIEYSTSSITNHGDFVRTLKDRVQSQLEVVCSPSPQPSNLELTNTHLKIYSFIAQYDARISAKIAVSAGRDSTAMKTLAFITAVFLPGSYVASLFSISMFDWQASNSSSSNGLSVSSYIWVYWVVTIPLTLLVMIVWRKWWQREDRAYKKELDGEEKIQGVSERW